jgi:shikimate kinase
MPGAGKSTIGVLLAKTLGMDFIDTDILMQNQESRKLQEILNEQGIEAFLIQEERTILSVQCTHSVIATGGSVVYREKAMRHLQQTGALINIRSGSRCTRSTPISPSIVRISR